MTLLRRDRSRNHVSAQVASVEDQVKKKQDAAFCSANWCGGQIYYNRLNSVSTQLTDKAKI
jgi:hypothetical protein